LLFVDLKNPPIIDNKKHIPNACQNVNTGDAVQNKGVNQFHNHIKINGSIVNASKRIIKINKQLPIIFYK
jgi:hypothetical protein